MPNPLTARCIWTTLLAAGLGMALTGCNADPPPLAVPSELAAPDDDEPPPLEALPAEPVEAAPLDAAAAPPPDPDDNDPRATAAAALFGQAVPASPEGTASAEPTGALEIPETLVLDAASPAATDAAPVDPSATPVPRDAATAADASTGTADRAGPGTALPPPAFAPPTGTEADDAVTDATDPPPAFERRVLTMPDDLPRADVPELGALSVDEDPIEDQPALLGDPFAEATTVQVAAPVQRIRQGPWQITCFQGSEVVFEHREIYRVWLDDHTPPQWAYETVDGIRFRGRIGSDVHCQWLRR